VTGESGCAGRYRVARRHVLLATVNGKLEHPRSTLLVARRTENSDRHVVNTARATTPGHVNGVRSFKNAGKRGLPISLSPMPETTTIAEMIARKHYW
jgi:hypothetical protein